MYKLACALVAVVAWFASGCVHRAHGAPVGSVSTPAPPQPIPYETVAAGTVFRVSLVQPLRVAYTVPGETFRATVLDKLTSREGRVVVPAGAWIEGRIVGVDLGATEAIRVAFDTIGTARGAAEVRATVFGEQRFRGGTASPSARPEASGYDALFVPPAPAAPSAIGGGPLDSLDATIAAPARAVVALPAGTVLTLVLRSALEMP